MDRVHFLRWLWLGHFLSWWPVVSSAAASSAGRTRGLTVPIWADAWLLPPLLAQTVVCALGLGALWCLLDRRFDSRAPWLLGLQCLAQAYFFSIHLPFASSFSLLLWAFSLVWCFKLDCSSAVLGAAAGMSVAALYQAGLGGSLVGLFAPLILMLKSQRNAATIVLALWALIVGGFVDYDLGVLLASLILVTLFCRPEFSFFSLCLGLAVGLALPSTQVEEARATYEVREHVIRVDSVGRCWSDSEPLVKMVIVDGRPVLNPQLMRQRRFWLRSAIFHHLVARDLALNSAAAVALKLERKVGGEWLATSETEPSAEPKNR